MCMYTSPIYVRLGVLGPKVDSCSSMEGARRCVFDFGCLFMDTMVQGSPRGDALQQADTGAAIKSFWRCKFVEV